MLVANEISENRSKTTRVASPAPKVTWDLHFLFSVFPLFVQTQVPKQSILMRIQP